MRRVKSHLFVSGVVMLTALSACGDSGGTRSTPAPASNLKPTAVIQGSTSIQERTSFALSGTSSRDSDGRILTYAWTVSGIDGVDVAVSGNATGTLTINVGELADDLTITATLVVTDDDRATGSTSQTISLTEVDRARLPPDPGSAGQESVAGIDSDNNGVRDDLEHSLMDFMPLETSRRELMKFGGKAFQQAILSGEGGGDTQQDRASEEIAKFTNCLAQISPEEMTRELSILRSLMVNTPERREAYRAFNASQAGTIQRAVDVARESCFVN